MCDTVVVVEDDRVWFAKNSDRDPNEAQVLEWWPARAPDGGTVRCTWIDVPQVATTNAVLISRPAWMWGCEMGTNEHGVTIGNEAVFTREPYADSGLTGMDLIRLALERSDSAEGAVGTITDLLGEHGQGGGCGHEDRGFTYHNSFIVADPTTAFVLETAGRHWAVESVTGVRSISNGLTIPGFADEHSDRLRSRVASCRSRQTRTTELAHGVASPTNLFALLRDDGPGNAVPRYSPLNGAMSAPNMKAGGLVANSQTTSSWVSELRPGRHRHWATGTAGPDTSLFKPVAVATPVDVGEPGEGYDPAALWWSHEVLHRIVDRDPARLRDLFTVERDAVEARWVRDDVSSAEAFAKAGALEAVWTERVRAAVGRDTRPWWVRRYWGARDRRAGMPL